MSKFCSICFADSTVGFADYRCVLLNDDLPNLPLISCLALVESKQEKLYLLADVDNVFLNIFTTFTIPMLIYDFLFASATLIYAMQSAGCSGKRPRLPS